MSTSLKVILVVLAVAVVGAGGAEIYSKYYNDSDWAVYERVRDYLTGVKNEEAGCCLPQCGEAGKTICEQSAGQWTAKKCDQISACEKGCCPPNDGLVTREECKQLNGNNTAWKKQEDCQGVWTNIEGKGQSDVIDGTAAYTFTFKLHSCDKEQKNWEGSWSLLWQYTTSVGTHTEPKTNEATSFTLESGEATVKLMDIMDGTVDATFKKSGKTMSVHVKFGNTLNPVDTSGEIFKGAALCEESNKNQ